MHADISFLPDHIEEKDGIEADFLLRNQGFDHNVSYFVLDGFLSSLHNCFATVIQSPRAMSTTVDGV
jgi:hypothetical protein